MASAFSIFDNEKPFSWKDAVIGLVLAIIASAVTTAIAFFLVDAAGLIPDSVTIERMGGDVGPITASDAVGSVIFYWIFGGIIFLLLRKFSAQPLKWFAIVAIVACIVSFIFPVVQIEDIPAKMVVGLNILHVVAVVSGVGTLIAYLRSRG
ncbi:MAG: DUF6069 family protein [Thermomicrobiales bacterium]